MRSVSTRNLNPPSREISRQFKQQMRIYVDKLAEEANIENHSLLADELCLLLEGAIVTAQVSQRPTAALTAKKIAQKLIE